MSKLGKTVSQRQLRVGEMVKQALGMIFLRGEAKLPNLETKEITVTEVRMSQDLKVAKAFVLPLGGKNFGDLVHEFNIATKEMHIKHQPEMIKMMERGILLGNKIDQEKMKEMAKKDHSMAHSHSNSVLLEPGQTGKLIWKFNSNTKIEAACNVPGHYESGMIAKISL